MKAKRTALKNPALNFSALTNSYTHGIITGGLGKLMVKGQMEVWICDRFHPCSSPTNSMCWAYREDTQMFIPWATNSHLHLFDEKEAQLAIGEGDSHDIIATLSRREGFPKV